MTPEQIAKKADEVGARIARRLFEGRGNHSEMHLSESDLAAAFSAVYEIGFKNGQEQKL